MEYSKAKPFDSEKNAPVSACEPNNPHTKSARYPYVATRERKPGDAADTPIIGATHSRRTKSALKRQAIIGSSDTVCEMREQIRLYAAQTAAVLITGETGVGKELVARELHTLSDRQNARMVAVNAAAIPEQLAQSEFFGHVKGAFTDAHETKIGAFAEADGGTIFLDEIGDLPAPMQAQLLRVLDNRMVSKIGERRETPVDFRLVAATNIDLERSVERGAFRKDLFYRINVLVIHVPPLRERHSDIPELAEHFIRTHENEKFRNAHFSKGAIDAFENYDFPGNIRELKNLLERALIAANGGLIERRHLKLNRAARPACAASLNIPQARQKITTLLSILALTKASGNATKAAQLTGLTRSTFHNIKKELDASQFDTEAEVIRAELESFIYGR